MSTSVNSNGSLLATNAEKDSSTFSAQTHCLCIGSGVTSKLVGDWNKLLEMLLERRFVSDWLSNGLPFDKIAPSMGANCFRSFFPEEGLLELGEFILAEEINQPPSGFTKQDDVWQELLFAQQVSDVVDQSIEEALRKPCNNNECAYFTSCAFAGSHSHDYRSMYSTYIDSGCKCKSFGSAMAIVDLCLNGKVKYVITYNFDTVVEKAIFDILTSDDPETKSKRRVKEIHIWTYGKAQKPRLAHEPTEGCTVMYHQGTWNDDAESLTAAESVHFFHVHGVASSPWIPDVTGQIVFSQHSYDLYQDSPLNWGNRVLEYLCSRYNLLAVGFSGTDANFRAFARYHDRAAMGELVLYEKAEDEAESTNHQITLLKAKEPYRTNIKSALEKKLTTNQYEELKEYFLNYCIAMVKNYYQNNYKIETIWVDDYVEIATWLNTAFMQLPEA